MELLETVKEDVFYVVKLSKDEVEQLYKAMGKVSFGYGLYLQLEHLLEGGSK